MACVVVGLGAVTFAHPTAASFVVIQTPTPNTVRVTVTTEASPLLMKLEALAGRIGGADGASPAEIDRRIREFGPVLLEQIELRLDGNPAALEIQSLQRVSARSEQVELVLTGQATEAITDLTWSTRLFFGSYPLAVRGAGTDIASDADTEQYEWLSGSERSQKYSVATLSQAEGGWRRTGRMIAIGFTHILPGGLDHVLFVLGLFLLAADPRTLLLQVSAFTIAHSLTLALAVTGWVSVPGSTVEPLIALSIAYVAIENLTTATISRWRLAVVFAFGLVHGLGFAGALGELGLSRAHLVSTLIGFNVGVELGQLAVVTAAALVVRALPLTPASYRRLLARPLSIVIAATGLVWAVERALGNWITG